MEKVPPVGDLTVVLDDVPEVPVEVVGALLVVVPRLEAVFAAEVVPVLTGFVTVVFAGVTEELVGTNLYPEASPMLSIEALSA